MNRIAKEVVGQVLCFIGFVGVALACGLPMWRVTTFIGANIVTGQIISDGLWMNCVMQSTGQMQCSIQQFILRLTRDLQAGRALVLSSVAFAVIGLALTSIGAKCTSCLSNESARSRMVIAGGVLCIVAGVLCLIPVSWSAAFTITDFLNPATVDTQRRDLGASIYIGWGSSGLLIVGGSILCSSCPPDDRAKYYPTQYYPPPYSYPGSMVTPGPYVPVKYVQPSQYAPTPTVKSQYAPTQPTVRSQYAPTPTVRSQYAPSQYL